MIKKSLFISIMLLIGVMSYTSAQTQEEKQHIYSTVDKSLNEWFKNPTDLNETLNPEVIKQFKDSGEFVKGKKEGIWIEFSLDTSSMGQKSNVTVGDKKIEFTSSAILQKEKGVYTSDKRDGTWLLYVSYDKKIPFHWMRRYETNYKNGEKNGKEILFSLDDTIMVRTFVNGQEQGIGKIFDTNYPHSLQTIYTATGGNLVVLESYFPDGQLQTKYTDTVLFGKYLKRYKEFYRN